MKLFKFTKREIDFLKEIFLYLKKQNLKNKDDVINKIREFLKYKKYSPFFPQIWMINYIYYKFFDNKKIDFLKLTKVVSVRSLSGIIPVSVFTKPKNSCPYQCVYCPLVENAPKSYFPDEAAVKRALRSQYHPFWQTLERLLQLFLSGHKTDKIDLIIQGGTFSFYSKSYRTYFLKSIFQAANINLIDYIKNEKIIFKKTDLLKEQKINEKALNRIIGITIETRPDYINEKEVLYLRKIGVTRVELGVQTIDDQILKLVKRGHGINSVVKATKLLKEAGFKITYHLMPGLPGSTFNKDLQMLKEVFQNESFKPDNIKFYPTQLAKNTQLVDWYLKKKFKPIDEEYLYQLTKIFKKEIVPPWLRINRLVRDLTRNDLYIETFPSNYRQVIQERLKKEKVSCQCIRCREIKNNQVFGKTKINIIRYYASSGIEYFIEEVDEKYQLLGFLRLRIPEFFLNKEKFFIDELNETVLIRELHVYGEATAISNLGPVQHRGIGKRLINQAIKIAKKYQAKKIAVISGVGVRDYYRKLGFSLTKKGFYMIKDI